MDRNRFRKYFLPINGLNKLLILLSKMFNAMLTHGFNPDDVLLSIIISILKDNRGLVNSSDKCRGISHVNSNCKLYDFVFIDLNMEYVLLYILST